MKPHQHTQATTKRTERGIYANPYFQCQCAIASISRRQLTILVVLSFLCSPNIRWIYDCRGCRFLFDRQFRRYGT